MLNPTRIINVISHASQFGISAGASMFRVVIIFIWILQSTNADLTQNITIKFQSEKNDYKTALKCENGTSFVLRDNVPTMMYINYSSTINVHECSPAKNSGVKFDVTQFRKIVNYSEANVKSLIEGEVHCYFLMNKDNIYIYPLDVYDNQNYTRVGCSFKIVIKYLREFNVKINGHVLDKTVVTSSDEVDAKIEYYFVPKERVDITCFISTGGLLAVICPQYNSSCQQFGNELSFQMVLESHHNNSHIDCILNKTDSKTVIRVFMLLKKNYDEKDIIRINGMAIRAMEKEEKNSVVYNYYGDMPNVTCPSTSSFDMAPVNISEYKAERVCDINGKNSTIILSKQQHPDNGIYIDGLDDGRILLHTFCAEQVIHYSYTDNDVLEFEFSYGTEHKNVNWTLEGFNNSDKHTNSFNYSMKEEYNLGRVILKPENDDKKTVIIVFHYRKKDVTYEEGWNINAQLTEDEKILHNDHQDPLTSSDPDDNFLTKYYIQLIGGVLVTIFVLILIYLVILIKRRKRALKGEQSDVHYVNLENNKPEAQFPKLNDSVYLQPPKESEDYAVPVDVSGDVNPYSVPYKPTLEELYAKPTPKHKRDNKNEDEVTYSEIRFMEPENMYSKVNKPNAKCIYAEVHPVKEKDLYGKVKPKSGRRDEYVNDFNSSAYVNAERDIVEPAYCEISALRK